LQKKSASVAVIGAGDFIGGEIAKKFAAEGFTVFVGRRQGEKLVPLVKEIEAAGGTVFGRALDARLVRQMSHAAEPDILAQLELILVEVLKQHAEPLAKRVGIPRRELAAVENDAPLARLVQASQELDEGRLASAVFAHERNAVTGRDLELDVAERPGVLARVVKAHVLEADARAGRDAEVGAASRALALRPSLGALLVAADVAADEDERRRLLAAMATIESLLAPAGAPAERPRAIVGFPSARSARAYPAAERGRRAEKRLPCPGVLSTETVPPRDSTIRFVSANPSPAPA